MCNDILATHGQKRTEGSGCSSLENERTHTTAH
uniref:Uncharacterized protein n=1 Tax=Anguilla anguilla TaxID=7936 RepID=A0A0E9S826_ANGAN